MRCCRVEEVSVCQGKRKSSVVFNPRATKGDLEGSCNDTMGERKPWNYQMCLSALTPCLSVTVFLSYSTLLILILNYHQVSGVAESSGGQLGTKTAQFYGGNSLSPEEDFCNGQSWCSSLNEIERLALEAIRYLHRQLDDDNNGSIDLKESNGYLREELNYDKGYEKRHKNFHRNNDNQISVKNLWELWISSDVHNWTAEQTADWVATFVGLPEYEAKIVEKNINGTYLPRMAANLNHFLSQGMGVRDSRHKQKLALKATDVVLFGAPKEFANRLRETILTTSLAIALTVIWVVYRRYQNSQRDLNKMSKEIASLTEAENALKTLQEELSKTNEEITTNGVPDRNANSQDQKEELEILKAEVQYLKKLLEDAEHEIQDKCWLPPPNLRYYLQQTYDIELRAYNHKKNSAERQLRLAREACNKLKEKKSSFIHAFVAANSKAVDEVDKAIVEAKTSLQEVTTELRERMHRWKEIESLANFKIVSNSGGRSMEAMGRNLASIGRSSSGGSTRSRPSSLLHDSQESLLE
ncbi:unnamed protein product [Allacma fusca]|uniref:SAM domain-containing protein n=1 Tax=Allacma fusca TaxID=39272 RepID=A0A8J2LTK4_9HEXA|nr:unnamed protein product [Allacma fusca]